MSTDNGNSKKTINALIERAKSRRDASLPKESPASVPRTPVQTDLTASFQEIAQLSQTVDSAFFPNLLGTTEAFAEVLTKTWGDVCTTLTSDLVNKFVSTTKPSTLTLCVGISLCKLLKYLSEIQTGSLAYSTKMDKTWAGIKTALKTFSSKSKTASFSAVTPSRFRRLKGTPSSFILGTIENIGRIMKVYLSGADMTERNLAMNNKAAETIFKLIKRVSSGLESHDDTKLLHGSPSNHSMTPLNKSANDASKLSGKKSNPKLFHYDFKTDPKNSPTRRLIDIKKIREKSPVPNKIETEVILYSSSPNLVVVNTSIEKSVKAAHQSNLLSTSTASARSLSRHKTPGWKETTRKLESRFAKEFMLEFEKGSRSHRTNTKKTGSDKKRKTLNGFNIKPKVGDKKASKQEYKGKLQFYDIKAH